MPMMTMNQQTKLTPKKARSVKGSFGVGGD